MKKSLILVGMLVIGYANAQEGTVGINTSNPKATLDIQPNATNLTGTTNEGILAPRLSKERIANIATPVEGTLVYATDNTYTGANTKVSKINEKGYYFYNGTEWVKASAGNALSSNIYTADGTLTGDRKVTMGDKILSFEGNNGAKYLEVKNASWYPLVVNSTNSQGGGIAVHPNNLDNRAEFSVNEKGDMRFYQHGNGDVMFVQKSTNRVGIGTIAPKSKLDVRGGIRASQGYPQGDDTNLGYAFGNDGDTGLFSEADATNSNIAKSLSLYTNNQNRIFIKNDGGFVGINNTNPKVRLDVIGGGRFKRIGSSSTIEIDTDNGQWGHLDFRRNDVKRWDIGMTNGEETGGEAGSNFFISSFKDDGSFNASGLFINRKTGYTGIGTSNPEAGLDVAGELIARGQNQTDAYFGGDNFPAVPGRAMNDVEIGSVKAGVTDISLYNRADAKTMNLFANDLNAAGNVKSNTLSGDGDKIVMANNDGTLVKGVSISNFATSNIYTANGVLTSDRVVDQAGKWLTFHNGGVSITGNDGVYFPLTIRTMHSGGNGGIQIEPNGVHEKRIEFNSTPEGNIRLWADGDRIYVNRTTGNVGIGTTAPTEKLDVAGSIKSTALAGTGTRVVMADNTGKLVIGTNIRTETTATTLAESDNGGYVYINSSSAVNVTVPSTLPIGFSCVVVQKGTGQVTIVGSGATHETARGTKTRTKHSAIGIIKDTASTFTITGDAIN